MILVYTKNNCTYCSQAKQLLKQKGVTYSEINIEESPEARDFLINKGHKTVPQIYKDNEILVEGGFQGLLKQDADFFNALQG